MIFMKRYSLLFIACLFSLCCLSGNRLVFTPQWVVQAQFVGYYVALEKGFYTRAGLDVVIEHTTPSNPCVNLLKDGRSQFVTLDLVSAMKFYDEGLRLVNVMQTSHICPLMLISRKPIKSVKDLQGKRVGHWKAGFSELGFILDKERGLNIEWIPFLENMNLFISGAIDATLAMSYNEYFQLIMAGRRLKDSQLLFFSDLGYDVPGDGLYVTESFYKKHRNEVLKFVEASRRGWEWAYAHPEEALEIVMRMIKRYEKGTNRRAQRWMLEQMLNGLSKKASNNRTYVLDEGGFALANRLLYDNGFIRHKISYKDFAK